jgi:YD repeat-containing protein
MAAQDKSAVQEQTQESLLYGIAAGGANPNMIHRAGEQSGQEAPQEGNPDLLYGVGAASQDSQRNTQGSYTYTQDGKTVGRSQTTGDNTRVYGADGREVGRIQEQGDTTRTYGADGRVTGRVQKSGGTSQIYGADGRTRLS